jgi:hypothetical protein
MATGSYEGSLSTEGTSGHLPCWFSRTSSDVGLGVSLSPPTHVARSIRNGARGQHARRCVTVRATRESRQGCQRSRPIQRHGSNRPALVTIAARQKSRGSALGGVGAEAVSGVVKTPSPSVIPSDDHGSSRVSRIAKVVRGAGNERRWVFVSIRMAEVGWTHRASFTPGGRKASWSEGR